VRETALVPGCFPATDRVMLRLFQPDGRAASGPLPVRRTASGLAWSRPPGLAPGIYLLRLELANSAATWRVVLTP